MDWIPYLPPLLSMYLLFISGLPKSYIKSKVADFVSRPPVATKQVEELMRDAGLDPGTTERVVQLTTLFWKSKEAVIQNIALDWAARLGFFNSIIAAIFSVFSIYSKTQSIDWLVGTLVPLLLITAAMIWYIMKHDIDELVATRTVWNLTPATLCKITLFIVNLILIMAIYISHRPPHPAGTPSQP